MALVSPGVAEPHARLARPRFGGGGGGGGGRGGGVADGGQLRCAVLDPRPARPPLRGVRAGARREGVAPGELCHVHLVVGVVVVDAHPGRRPQRVGRAAVHAQPHVPQEGENGPKMKLAGANS